MKKFASKKLIFPVSNAEPTTAERFAEFTSGREEKQRWGSGSPSFVSLRVTKGNLEKVIRLPRMER
jgi:hypothetical protein